MNNKKAHETAESAVIDNGSTANHFTIEFRRDKRVGIGSPKNFRVMQASIPTFVGRPIHKDIQFRARHVSNVELVSSHVFILSQKLCAAFLANDIPINDCEHC